VTPFSQIDFHYVWRGIFHLISLNLLQNCKFASSFTHHAVT